MISATTGGKGQDWPHTLILPAYLPHAFFHASFSPVTFSHLLFLTVIKNKLKLDSNHLFYFT